MDENEQAHHRQLIKVIGWFFFDLLMLGYVEDSHSGLSFRIPGGLAWAIYVEVCVVMKWQNNRSNTCGYVTPFSFRCATYLALIVVCSSTQSSFYQNVQVPSHAHIIPEEALKYFQQEIPALGLLGTSHYIHPDTPYCVDEEVQLVCKYLKALQMGGTRGIDRLYQEGSCVCVRVCTIFLNL